MTMPPSTAAAAPCDFRHPVSLEGFPRVYSITSCGSVRRTETDGSIDPRMLILSVAWAVLKPYVCRVTSATEDLQMG